MAPQYFQLTLVVIADREHSELSNEFEEIKELDKATLELEALANQLDEYTKQLGT